MVTVVGLAFIGLGVWVCIRRQLAYGLAGIALIVQLVGQERRAGRRLLACCLSEHFARVLRITRLTDFINLFVDEQSAVAAVAAS